MMTRANRARCSLPMQVHGVVDGSFNGYAEVRRLSVRLQSLFRWRGKQVTGSFRLAQIHAGGMMPVCLMA